MSKPSFFARLGAAFTSFAGDAAATPPAASVPTVKKGSIAPFDRIPIIDGGEDTKVNRPFEQSVWVMRAIKEISGPIAAVELKFYSGDVEITDAPWLSFWRKPVRNLSQADFIEALTGWIKLAGEAFILLPPEFTVPFPDVMKNWPPLILARPECMVAIKSTAGALLQWEYRGPNGQRLKLPPEQVIQPRCWNPYDDIRGMSEYESARVATEGDYLSGKFALNLARANGDTGVVITMKEGSSLTDDQQNQVRSQLRAKKQKSQNGEFASIFLPADLTLQDPMVKAPDAQFVAQRLENRHEIYIAFGVPPSMADVVASYSVGSASDWYRLITGTCIPTAAKIEDVISQIATRMHGSEVEAYFEFDEHPVMQSVRRERIDAGTKLWDRGMPWSGVSEYLDLDLPRFAGDDTGYISFGLAPVGAAPADPKVDPALAEPDSSEAVQEMFAALRSPITNPPAPGPKAPDCECCNFDFASLQIRASDSADVKLWKSLVAKRRQTIQSYESKFNRVLILARAEVLQKLQHWDTLTKSHQQKAVAADFIFDLGDFTKKFQAQMRQAALNALQTAGDQLHAELKIDDPWKMPQAEAIDFVRNRENKLSGVPADVHGRIKDVLESGLTSGDSLNQIASAIRSEFNDISARRAGVIASTETAAAYGTGRQLAMEAAGIQFKRWLTSGNANVRQAHMLMNGTVVAIDALFLVINPKTGESDEVLHPADPDGAPWNVINCHCVEVAEAKPEEAA